MKEGIDFELIKEKNDKGDVVKCAVKMLDPKKTAEEKKADKKADK